MPPVKLTLKKKVVIPTTPNAVIPKPVATEPKPKPVIVPKLKPKTTIVPKLKPKPGIVAKPKPVIVDYPEDLESFLYNGQTYCFSEKYNKIFSYNNTISEYEEVGGIYEHENSMGAIKNVMYIHDVPISPKDIKAL
jgi:hypothetical protein